MIRFAVIFACCVYTCISRQARGTARRLQSISIEDTESLQQLFEQKGDSLKAFCKMLHAFDSEAAFRPSVAGRAIPSPNYIVMSLSDEKLTMPTQVTRREVSHRMASALGLLAILTSAQRAIAEPATATAPAPAQAAASDTASAKSPTEIVLEPETLSASQLLSTGSYIKDLQKARKGLDEVRKLVETPDAEGGFKLAKEKLRSLPVAYVAFSCVGAIDVLKQLGIRNMFQIKSAQAEVIKARLEKLDRACEPKVENRPDLQLLITDIQRDMDVFSEGLILKKAD